MGLTPDGRPSDRRPSGRRRRAAGGGFDLNPVSWFVRWADWFEARGVYVPGEDSRSLSPLRDFGWLIAGGLIAVSAFVVLFAIVS
ncbi:MAG TPA: hypothetical protein VHF06_32465 [Pseudonocardiaceae bacterium]|nr:hypothetical protein [Pseudonocardiaceae bacterium]